MLFLLLPLFGYVLGIFVGWVVFKPKERSSAEYLEQLSKPLARRRKKSGVITEQDFKKYQTKKRISELNEQGEEATLDDVL